MRVRSSLLHVSRTQSSFYTWPPCAPYLPSKAVDIAGGWCRFQQGAVCTTSKQRHGLGLFWVRFGSARVRRPVRRHPRCFNAHTRQRSSFLLGCRDNGAASLKNKTRRKSHSGTGKQRMWVHLGLPH
ncbi:hypothetical protein NDU88_002809 [Pleurodeles waltl]|uniref:Uncharacterized protein n=1 Tax=Pleurodeles waltl TaxID=8319 RepID=A0AAV7UYB9_PLEWA|nr:hypothetical protein NDU88_002809 [Pleurodeles waltl]